LQKVRDYILGEGDFKQGCTGDVANCEDLKAFEDGSATLSASGLGTAPTVPSTAGSSATGRGSASVVDAQPGRAQSLAGGSSAGQWGPGRRSTAGTASLAPPPTVARASTANVKLVGPFRGWLEFRDGLILTKEFDRIVFPAAKGIAKAEETRIKNMLHPSLMKSLALLTLVS
jgi:hypothetical protein